MKNTKTIKLILILVATLLTCSALAQNETGKSSGYLGKRWGEVATRMPADWYGSEEAKLVAENVMLAQKDMGGWEKNKPYHQAFTEEEKAEYARTKSEKGGTFDNGATITELRFLAKVYRQMEDEKYRIAFKKGLNYIFVAQYKNGGWPQYFPVKEANSEIQTDHTVPYSMHITFNDNAMVNIMMFLKDVYADNEEFVPLQISKKDKLKAVKAFDKGIHCFLKTQIIVNGKPTVWCAQHDEVTLTPANARSYELASFSGSESVGIVLLLMGIEHPSKEIIESVKGAKEWFETHKIEGIRIDTEIDQDGKRNRVVVEDKNAPALWGRFYDLETGKPFFCSRDGIKRNTLAEISFERRNGYSWYTGAPEIVLNKYPEWEAKQNSKKY